MREKRNGTLRWAAGSVAAALILLLASFAVLRQDAQAVSLQLKDGENSVTVSIQGMVDNITDGKLVVSYDQGVLTYSSAAPGDAWGSQTPIYEVNAGEGQVTLAFVGREAPSNGILFDLTFTRTGSGSQTTEVNLTGDSYLNGNGTSLTVSSSVTIPGDAEPSPEPSPEPSASPEPSPEPSQPGTDPSPSPSVPTGGGGGGGGIVPPPPTASPELPDQPCDGGITCPSRPFTDVNTSSWYHEGVDYVVENGLMQGVTSTLFDPSGNTTRGMLVTILYRLAGEPAVSGSMSFTDVPASAYYRDAVLWAVENGITMGFSQTTFGPSELISREQLVTFLYRYAQWADRDTSAQADLSVYPDQQDISGYARTAMAWAVAEEIVQGGNNNSILPLDPASRSQIATIIYRFDTADNG